MVLNSGEFFTTDFDPNNHYPDNIKIIEKWKAEKVWTAVILDADNNGYLYL